MSKRIPHSDRISVRSKLAGKYDVKLEKEILDWIEKLIEIKLEPGIQKVEKQLKNGQILVKLAQKIQQNTPNCPEKAKNMNLKFNTNSMPLKQMENIQIFLGFCENYGVPIYGLFHTKDLFDGNNLMQVLSCIQQLGSECQRHEFDGPTIGPKPNERHIKIQGDKMEDKKEEKEEDEEEKEEKNEEKENKKDEKKKEEDKKKEKKKEDKKIKIDDKKIEERVNELKAGKKKEKKNKNEEEKKKNELFSEKEEKNIEVKEKKEEKENKEKAKPKPSVLQKPLPKK